MRPQHRSSILLLAGAAALALGAFLACDSPFEPVGQGERVPIGLVIEDQVSGDTVNWYSFAAFPSQLLVVFLDASQGNVQLAVFDSTHQTLVATMSAGPNGPALDENPSNTFGGTTTGAVYRLRANSFSGSTARFRFKVYAIDQAPERVPALFAFGDTVTGETIDPMVDLDEFFAHGQAGQEIVAVAETPGPVGSGSVALTVIDPVANDLLGYVFADAGTSNRLTTGRLRLPATHDYRVTFGSVTSNQYPRYQGPYRFWTYLVNRAPEHRAAAIPRNAEVTGERIDREGDVDEFTFSANVGDEFNAFVQASRAFQIEVAPQGGPLFAIAVADPSDTALLGRATGRFRITQAGTYVVRVSGTNSHQVADTGAYRLYLYAIDRRPEHVPSAIAPGDTVTGEDIGLSGDIDEFTFSGAAGDEFNVFLQAQSGSSETRLQLDVLDGGGTVLRSAESLGTDTSLLRQVTGRFALPSTGTYRLRVSGAPYYPYDFNRGAYRLFLYRINRRPEMLPGTLAFGDSLSGEAIDLPGDVDEFRVTVPDSSGANLALALESPSDGGLLAVQLVDSATGQVIATASTSQAATPAATGRMRLAPGKYVVRVSTSDYYLDRPILRGPYRLWFYRFGFGPEVVADTFAIGDTVSGEKIEPWGDEDRFHFYGVRGQHVNFALQGTAAPSNGWFQAVISPSGGGGGPPNVVLTGPTAGTALADYQTMRFELPATGRYDLSVSGGGGGLSERGGYRFVVELVGSAPEQVSAALVPGDSVTAESIDPPGDWDEYTVTATPGQDLGIVFDGRPGYVGPFAYVRAFDPGTGDTLAATVGQFQRVAGPFRAPASGRFSIAVFEPAGFGRTCYFGCPGAFRFVGPYAFKVIPINRAPENVPAAYATGDTVRGEALFPLGDLDEFTATGTPGDTLRPNYRLLAAPDPQGSLITLEVLDPTTGAVLAGWGASVFGASSEYFSPGSFVVPSTGTYVIRVRGGSLWDYEVGTAPYEFFVRRGP